MEKLLLYSPRIGPRLKYAATHLITEVLGLGLQFTCNLDEVRSASIPVINYSGSEIAGSVRIMPYGLLEEKGIIRQSIDVVEKDGTPFFFYDNQGRDSRL